MVIDCAENGQCVIDNTRPSTTIQINNSPRYPKFSDGVELAEAMQWIVRKGDDYVLGPNVRKEFPNNMVPEAFNLVKVMVTGDEIFYKIDIEVLHLSAFISWVFIDLDARFLRQSVWTQSSPYVLGFECWSQYGGR